MWLKITELNFLKSNLHQLCIRVFHKLKITVDPILCKDFKRYLYILTYSKIVQIDSLINSLSIYWASTACQTLIQHELYSHEEIKSFKGVMEIISWKMSIILNNENSYEENKSWWGAGGCWVEAWLHQMSWTEKAWESDVSTQTKMKKPHEDARDRQPQTEARAPSTPVPASSRSL